MAVTHVSDARLRQRRFGERLCRTGNVDGGLRDRIADRIHRLGLGPQSTARRQVVDSIRICVARPDVYLRCVPFVLHVDGHPFIYRRSILFDPGVHADGNFEDHDARVPRPHHGASSAGDLLVHLRQHELRVPL